MNKIKYLIYGVSLSILTVFGLILITNSSNTVQAGTPVNGSGMCEDGWDSRYHTASQKKTGNDLAHCHEWQPPYGGSGGGDGSSNLGGESAAEAAGW